MAEALFTASFYPNHPARGLHDQGVGMPASSTLPAKFFR